MLKFERKFSPKKQSSKRIDLGIPLPQQINELKERKIKLLKEKYELRKKRQNNIFSKMRSIISVEAK